MYELVSIEGNIGSGKSTIVQQLKKQLVNTDNVNYIFIDEPVDEWNEIKDENGKTMIEKYYSNVEKYSFAFQMMAFISRIVALDNLISKTNPNKKTYLITERSIFTDKYVFAKMLFDSKKIEDVEYMIYNKWFTHLSKNIKINKIIYVNTSHEKCFERIQKRSRDGEQLIEMSYLKDCQNYHENMVLNFKKDDSIKFLEIDGNIDYIKGSDEQINKWCKLTEKFCNT